MRKKLKVAVLAVLVWWFAPAFAFVLTGRWM